jgi:hypothetical protein
MLHAANSIRRYPPLPEGNLTGTGPVFMADITDEFILGLSVMHAHAASVDLRCHVL